jgi:protein TonB
MFEQTFVDGVGKTKKPYTIMLSFLIQIVMIGVLVVIPLIYYETMPGAQLSSFLVAPTPPPPPPPPPPPQVVKVVHTAPRQFVANQLIAPKSVPQKVLMVTEEEAPLATGVIGGIPGGMPGAGALGGIIGGLPAAAPPKAPPPPPKPVGPQRVGGKIQAASLVNQVRPTYPPLAKMARQQGTVRFEATISKEGTIQDLKVLPGAPPLLVQAATEAVKQWRYKPLLLNGEPVEVLTTIDVNFSLTN